MFLMFTRGQGPPEPSTSPLQAARCSGPLAGLKSDVGTGEPPSGLDIRVGHLLPESAAPKVRRPCWAEMQRWQPSTKGSRTPRCCSARPCWKRSKPQLSDVGATAQRSRAPNGDPGYMSRVLKNYTEHACDGEYISLRCPHRTTISIQSSFYGRKAPSHQMCPSRYGQSFKDIEMEDLSCSAVTSLQKMLDECQDRRSCQLLVNSRIFGTDPCPGTSKYLIVWYKCRPNEYKSKVACEDDKLRLNCKRSMVIAIYSAIFGRSQEGSLECPYWNVGVPAVDCQSTLALQIMTKRCHRKRSCSVYASSYEFGDPCYPGIRKFLNVIYTCVPKKLLDESNPKPTHYKGIQQLNFPPHYKPYDRNIVGDGVFSHDVLPFITEASLPEEKKKGRSASNYPMDTKPLPIPVDESDKQLLETRGIRTQMALLSNILETYSYVTENPEKTALYFLSGVCIGLILTLCALVVRISCQTDLKKSVVKNTDVEDSNDDDDSDDDNSDTTSDLSARRHRRFERTLNMNVFTSAEELERAQRLEERERIIREIWMNGQPDIPATRSLNRYY